MNNKSLWWYAHTEINKRWNAFNSATTTEEMLLERYLIDRTEKVKDEISLARVENMECDMDLRDHFCQI